jgi:hypothetical protein
MKRGFARNTDLESVRPAEFYFGEFEHRTWMSGSRTGNMPVFRSVALTLFFSP